MDKNTYKELALKNKEPINVIINLSLKGSHWVALKTDEKKNIHYYDSFGVYPPFNIKGRVIQYNTVQDQKLNEDNCGYLCLKFLSEN